MTSFGVDLGVFDGQNMTYAYPISDTFQFLKVSHADGEIYNIFFLCLCRLSCRDLVLGGGVSPRWPERGLDRAWEGLQRGLRGL